SAQSKAASQLKAICSISLQSRVSRGAVRAGRLCATKGLVRGSAPARRNTQARARAAAAGASQRSVNHGAVEDEDAPTRAERLLLLLVLLLVKAAQLRSNISPSQTRPRISACR